MRHNINIIKFESELQRFYEDRGWDGTILCHIDSKNKITILPSFFNGLINKKTNKKFPEWKKEDKQYEKWFLEISEEIMNKYGIKKEEIYF